MKHRHKHIQHKLRHLKPKKNILMQPLFWVGILFIALLGGAVYLLFFYPKFKIHSVSIFGNQKVSNQEIENIAKHHIGQQILGLHYVNMLTINTNNLRKELMTGFPNVEDVKIQKEWPQNIRIEVVERSPLAVFCPNKNVEQCFWIDKYGVIYEKLQIAGDNFIVRQPVKETSLITGTPLIEKRLIEAIAKIQQKLEHDFGIKVQEALISNPLIITTKEQWHIYFDPAENLDMQITKMDLLLRNEITPEIRQTLQYIYLQYKDRAYFK